MTGAPASQSNVGSPDHRPPPTVILPDRAIAVSYLAELVRYRELMAFLVWRDIKVRYKQTALGVAWAVLQPALTAAVFALLFGRIARMPSEGVPYLVFSYTGLLLWTFFAQSVSQAAASLVGAANLVTKVYFPRIVVPIAAVLSGLLDLLVAAPLLGIMMFAAGITPGMRLVFAPLAALLAVAAAIAGGVWLAALNVRYRDVRYVVPFLIQLGLFATPVIYPARVVSPQLERVGIPFWLYGLNPMAGAVEGFRASVLGVGDATGALVATSCLTTAVALVAAITYFRSVERSFADIV